MTIFGPKPCVNPFGKKLKMAIFGQKPWVNPFGKMSIFRLFELVVFYFPGLYSLKKKSWKNSQF